MVESQLSYEKRLKDSDEIIGRWRGDAGVLKKKNTTITKECDELRKEIEFMHLATRALSRDNKIKSKGN